ncbi:peptidoglycan DD-metalloendopeptidase family protein [Roseivirga sp.]|uniref:M23 family metallopeptidase n=1 Tax=Roseivirga sp. TaxID=1964215 RepID=UPI003B517556
MNKRVAGIAGLVLVAVAVTFFIFKSQRDQVDPELFEEAEEELVEEVVEPQFKFGIPLDLYDVEEGNIRRNQTFADILLPYNLSHQDIYTIDRISKDVHSARNLVVGKPYTIFYSSDSIKRASYFVYEPNNTEYVIYQLTDSLAVFKETRTVEVVEKTMAGLITISLDHAIREQGGSAALVNAVADLYGWQIDMKGLFKGDWFKVIYEEKMVDGQSVGIGNIIGAEFNHRKNAYMAYAYDQGEGLNYFDEEGESNQKAFLRYPVEYSRISSRYNPNRFHPVLKRRTPHLGTDYAANRGTPIKAAGDGVIIERGYTKGNGNYVKIKHNNTYTTGYLHMSKFSSLKKGQRVRKGDVIGYVGKTGLATGYHLCFRFWKRGKQVDFLREELPAETPLKEDHRINFETVVQLTNKKLNDIPASWGDGRITASNE